MKICKAILRFVMSIDNFVMLSEVINTQRRKKPFLVRSGYSVWRTELLILIEKVRKWIFVHFSKNNLKMLTNWRSYRNRIKPNNLFMQYYLNSFKSTFSMSCLLSCGNGAGHTLRKLRHAEVRSVFCQAADPVLGESGVSDCFGD